MYIKEVTIDGFKSYAQRVLVQKFDRNFNAITGLNGSGKSNILDAICFVLGMKNLAKVRPLRVEGWPSIGTCHENRRIVIEGDSVANGSCAGSGQQPTRACIQARTGRRDEGCRVHQI